MAAAVAFWHTSEMVRFGQSRGPLPVYRAGMRLLLCVLGLVVVWSGAVLAAQDEPKPQDGPIHTLHVYTNLMQIPTLVLGPNRERIKTPIAESRFSVSIDSGPWFRATHVRPEGGDPISLSILLDVSGDTTELMPKIGDAIASLAPLSLHPKDHVSIYALDCSLVQSLDDMPAENGGLKVAVDEALQSWTIRRQNKHEPDCQQSGHLWDALVHITGELQKLPGRRVILAVTDGRDKGSQQKWNELRAFAQTAGVAIFGLKYRQAGPLLLPQRYEDIFNSVCELSGGMVLITDGIFVPQQLERFTEMLRERYIVEVPRPANSTPGEHGILVKVAKDDNDFVRSAGITVPIPDAALLADPTTVPSDPSRTPELGTRKVMTKPQ
jgi:hypothetical protein